MSERGGPIRAADGGRASPPPHPADLDRADHHRPDRRLAGLGYLLQARPDHHRLLRHGRRPDGRPVPAQVQERGDGHGEDHRRVARPHQGAGDGRDGARGRAAAERQDDLLGGQAASSSPATSPASIRCCRVPTSACGRRPRRAKPQRDFIGKQDPPVLQAWAKGTTFMLREQAAGLDQPRLADLLPRSRGRHRAGLGSRRHGAATSPSTPSSARRSTNTCTTIRRSGTPPACR